MDNQGVQEFIVDQGQYYPAATDYYGYYCTGFESPRELDDHTFFGVDGQDLHYAGLQTESSPYVYYTPSYGCTQSPYNPYNPYIPGAFIGVDGPLVGAQQYFTGNPYEYSNSSPTYHPFLVQSTADNIPNSSLEPYFLNTGASTVYMPDTPGLKNNPSAASGRVTKVPSMPFSGDVKGQPASSASGRAHSSSKLSEQPRGNAGLSKHPAAQCTITSGSVSHPGASKIIQGRSACGPIQSAEQFLLGRESSLHAWAPTDKLTSKLQYGADMTNADRGLDLLGAHNRAPRTSRPRGQWTSPAYVKAYEEGAGTNNIRGHKIIRSDEYNKEDFLVNYVDAKFFVIKSYSEDDVHKSIKYNVWSSTPNGNKRLDSAYADAQRIAAGKPRACPVFLFFSVNASGQFCGVAEMVGPVDFEKDMHFWQQDKWSGSFPVKWHIIKDVSNTKFRHVILENNEYKPVTSSRDTQEIKYKQGMEMLNIFKNQTLKSSIFDDFVYYEDRQKIMQETKARLLRKIYNSSSVVPAIIPSTKINGLIDQPPSEEKKPTREDDQTNQLKTLASTNKKAPTEPDVSNLISKNGDNEQQNVAGDGDSLTRDLKMSSLNINSKQDEKIEPSASAVAAANTVTNADAVVDVFEVGSIPVKVNGFARASSGTLKVGTIDIYPKAVKRDHN